MRYLYDQFHVSMSIFSSEITDSNVVHSGWMCDKLNDQSNKQRAVPTIGEGHSGILFFYHLNKAGGTSMYENLRLLPNVRYYRAHHGEDEYERNIVKKITSLLEGERRFPHGKILVFEVHSGSTPSLGRTFYQLTSWKKSFREKFGIPFFVFTIVREPISHLISAFNYKCITQQNKCERLHKKSLRKNVDGLLRLAHENVQCFYFLRRWKTLNEEFDKKDSPSLEECKSVYCDKMKNIFDWIGTLEKYNETIDVLEKVLYGRNVTNSTFRSNFKIWNKSKFADNSTFYRLKANKALLSLSSLNDTAIAYLKHKSSYDQMMYQSIQVEYQMKDLYFQPNDFGKIE